MSTVTPLVAATPLTVRVAEEVRALMGRHRVSQVRLAEVMGVTQPQISKRLRGDISFDVDELETLARFFGVSPAALLGFTAVSNGPDGGGSGIPTVGYGAVIPMGRLAAAA